MALFDKLSKVASALGDDSKMGMLKNTAGALGNLMGSPKEKQQPTAQPAAAPASAGADGPIYSPELERMIEMALEDGELSDRDIELLAKRAEREGVDPDEFEFTMRMRVKKRRREQEALKNQNPVVGLSKAFSMLEQYAKGGKSIVSPDMLSGALALIPGVGQLAAAGGLLAAFIETPSNLNNLKAEAIRRFVLPDNPEYLAQFINYASSQQTEEQLAQKASAMSLKGMVSGITMGNSIDLCPIWDKKIEEACDKAEIMFPTDAMLMQTVRKNRPTLLKKLQSGSVTFMDLEDVTAPKDNQDLLDVVEFAFAKKSSDDWEDWKPFHARMYREAEARFAGDPAAMGRLTRYKVKKFGLF